MILAIRKIIGNLSRVFICPVLPEGPLVSQAIRSNTIVKSYCKPLEDQVGLSPGSHIDNGPKEGDYTAWVALYNVPFFNKSKKPKKKWPL